MSFNGRTGTQLSYTRNSSIHLRQNSTIATNSQNRIQTQTSTTSKSAASTTNTVTGKASPKKVVFGEVDEKAYHQQKIAVCSQTPYGHLRLAEDSRC